MKATQQREAGKFGPLHFACNDRVVLELKKSTGQPETYKVVQQGMHVSCRRIEIMKHELKYGAIAMLYNDELC